MQKSPGSSSPIDPELLRSTASPARLPQRTWEKGDNHYTAALYRQRLARNRSKSSAAAEDKPPCSASPVTAIPGSCRSHRFPPHQAQLPLAAVFSGHRLALGGVKGSHKGPSAPLVPPQPLFSQCRK